MVIGHILFIDPFRHLVVPVILDVSSQLLRDSHWNRSASLSAPLLDVCIPVGRLRELLQH
jgi:hypothetical protein